jgi:putative hemolysin
VEIDWQEVAPWIAAGVGLLILCGFFSGSEVALFGLRRMEREQLARSGRAIDSVVLRLLSQPRRLVTSVLVGNEAVTMTIAAITVALYADFIPELSTPALIAAAVGTTAPLVLLLGAVVPRTLAIKAPIAWARAAARPLAGFALVVTPVRWFVQTVGEGIGRVLGGGGRPRASGDLSEEEFRKLVDAGSAQGQVDARERRLIHKVFEFGDKNVGQIMTPRDKVFALSYDLPMQRLAKEVAARGFSRVPIFQRSLDNIRGILNAKDLVLATAGQAPARTLSELLHEPLFVPRTTPLARLFRTFKQKKVHMALVVSEYGGLLGVVTMEDLLEQLFGEIRDEREKLQARPATARRAAAVAARRSPARCRRCRWRRRRGPRRSSRSRRTRARVRPACWRRSAASPTRRMSRPWSPRRTPTRRPPRTPRPMHRLIPATVRPPSRPPTPTSTSRRRRSPSPSISTISRTPTTSAA